MKSISVLAFLFPLLFLTSCFDVIEDITLNSDGSGEMKYTINLSKSKSKLASVLLLDSLDGFKVPSKAQMDEQMNKAKLEMENLDGISEVKYSSNWDNFIFKFSFKFQGVKDVNSAVNSILDKWIQEESKKVQFEMFRNAEGVFSRKMDIKNNKGEPLKNNPNESNWEENFSSNDLAGLNEAYIVQVYRFSSIVKETSNTNAKISKNGSSVMNRFNVGQIQANPKISEITIKY